MASNIQQQPFADLWSKLGTGVEFASVVVEADPKALIAFFELARLTMGTDLERAALVTVTAMRNAALEQVKLADKAIATLETCSELVNKSALDAAEPERAAFQTAGRA
jgi:hypothetical protein